MPPALSQHLVNETTRLIARFDTILEDAMRSCSLGIMECDGAMAQLQGRATVRCEKCRIEVDATKLDLPGRCMDRHCPLKKDSQQ